MIAFLADDTNRHRYQILHRLADRTPASGLKALDFQRRVFVLQVSNELPKRGHLSQVFEVWVQFEEGPARETGIGSPIQPRHRLLIVPQHRKNASDLIVRVMRVTERAWGIQGAANTFKRRTSPVATGVQYTLKADNQGFVRKLLQGSRQMCLG